MAAAHNAHVRGRRVGVQADGSDVRVGLLKRKLHVNARVAGRGGREEKREVSVGVRPAQDVHDMLALDDSLAQTLGHTTEKSELYVLPSASAVAIPGAAPRLFAPLSRECHTSAKG